MAVYNYKSARVSAPVRAALALVALVALGGGVAFLRASDALTRAYQWCYVALAYPVAWTGATYGHLRGRTPAPVSWNAWVGAAAAR